MNDSLQCIALGIKDIQLTRNIHILPRWIPRSANKLAEKIRKIIDPDSWSVDRSIFNHFDSLWCPHSFDRFDDHSNAHCPIFVRNITVQAVAALMP
jgi:hypothetical protein